MTAIKRNLKYWGYSVEVLILSVLAVMVLLGLMEYLGEGLQEALAYLSGYMPMMCTIMMCMFGFVGVCTYFPFSMTMGSTRKASFIGMEVMAHAMAAQIVLLSAVLNMLNERLFGESEPYTVYTYLFWIFFSTGICNVVGAISIKCGRTAAMIAYILFAIIGGIGLAAAFSVIEMDTISKTVHIWLMLGSIVFDALAAVFSFLAVRKYEVRV